MKTGWKMLFLLIYIAVIAVLLADSFHVPGGEAEAEKRKVTLTFRHFWIQEHDLPVERIFRDIIEQFEREHPNIKIKFEGIDQTIHREQKLRSEMATGTQPDIIALFGGAEIEPYVRANRLLDLTPFLEEHALNERFKDLHLWTFDERVYGLPIEGNAEPLFYNKSIFERLGLSPPETIEELLHAVRTLKEAGYVPFALGNKQRWPAAIYAHYFMDRYAQPDLFSKVAEGRASFINPAYIQAFQKLEKLAADGAFPSDVNETGPEQAIRLFTESLAGMYLNGSWDITLFQNEPAPRGFVNEVGVVPFPAATHGGERAMAGGYTFGLGISADLGEEEKAAALDLFTAIYTVEVQERLVYEALRIPAMSVPIAAEQTGPIFARVVELTEQAERRFIPYDNMLSPEVKQAFLRVIAQLLEGRIGPEAALSELEDVSERYWSARGHSHDETKQ